jgi:hypothetical protein
MTTLLFLGDNYMRWLGLVSERGIARGVMGTLVWVPVRLVLFYLIAPYCVAEGKRTQGASDGRGSCSSTDQSEAWYILAIILRTAAVLAYWATA